MNPTITIATSPSQMLFALLALLRALGLLPYKPAPDENPSDGGYATMDAAIQAAHAYVNGTARPPGVKAANHLQIDQIAMAWANGAITLTKPG